LRRYTPGAALHLHAQDGAVHYGRGLHSSTILLNLSNSRTHSWFKLCSWVIQWTEELKVS